MSIKPSAREPTRAYLDATKRAMNESAAAVMAMIEKNMRTKAYPALLKRMEKADRIKELRYLLKESGLSVDDLRDVPPPS